MLSSAESSVDTSASPQPVKKKRYVAPPGDDNPTSYKQLLLKAARAKELEAEVADLKERLAGIDRYAAETDEEGGSTSAARMRKVLGQPPAADRGPTEKFLRETMNESRLAYLKRVEEMEREDRGGAGEGSDGGAEAARIVILRCLAEIKR